jgi:hypothetical protein
VGFSLLSLTRRREKRTKRREQRGENKEKTEKNKNQITKGKIQINNKIKKQKSQYPLNL